MAIKICKAFVWTCPHCKEDLMSKPERVPVENVELRCHSCKTVVSGNKRTQKWKIEGKKIESVKNEKGKKEDSKK